MLPWALKAVAALTGGHLEKGECETKVLGVRHDSRKVEKGDLFVAVVGEKRDGHRFIAQALKQGAVAALVSKKTDDRIPQVKVTDTTRAFGELGRAQRLQWNGPVAAVTGSVGKTTVKDMAAFLVSGTRRTLKSEGNFNNQYGLPMTLLGLERGHEAAVVELGINHPGEMERLSEIARPDVAVVTAIGEAHLGFFNDRRHLAQEKLKIAVALRTMGMMVLNAEDPLLKVKGRRVLTFGLGKGDVRAVKLRPEVWGTHFVLETPEGKAETRLEVLGEHNVRNAAAAVAVGLALGVPLKSMVGRLRKFRAQAPMRMQVQKVKGLTVINDTYNASPSSMEAALKTLSSLKGRGRKTAVLGDMLEMGRFTLEAHRRVVRSALRSPLDAVLLVGRGMREAWMSLSAKEKTEVYSFETTVQAGEFLRAWAKPGDQVLLKASRGMELEKIMEGF